ncbi:hepatocyte cell adhesion molecule-like [Megalobrama amblycephala]|uniref:hepatocyte cell adhesion molecule-like n=1 Tax=Megalobrama amblycephala TaxID=75352 RepID=UPI0020142657|nr:hepatocyte cell adhesion molecule-like [Megalobrama amblycephala]
MCPVREGTCCGVSEGRSLFTLHFRDVCSVSNMTGSDHANSSEMKMLTLICLCSCSLAGVFGVDELKMEVSVTEGESVTLNPDLTELQRDNPMWKFENILIAKINRQNNTIRFYNDNADGRFRDRLKLDHQTGSLTITNSRTTDSGLYTVTRTSNETPLNTFNLTVYARLPVPVISRDSSLNSSSSSCSLVCSAVVNVSHVTLSWFKGNSVLSNISVSNLSRSDLLLHLECVDDSYSCVLNNPIRNQTQHLNTRLCHTCAADLPVSWTVLISAAAAAAAGSLLIVIALGIFCICRKHRKTEPQGKNYLKLLYL